MSLETDTEFDGEISDFERDRRRIAQHVAVTFLDSDSGKRALLHLRRKFAHERPRYGPAASASAKSANIPPQVYGSIVDGQCSVLYYIEQALDLVRPGWRVLFETFVGNLRSD